MSMLHLSATAAGEVLAGAVHLIAAESASTLSTDDHPTTANSTRKPGLLAVCLSGWHNIGSDGFLGICSLCFSVITHERQTGLDGTKTLVSTSCTTCDGRTCINKRGRGRGGGLGKDQTQAHALAHERQARRHGGQARHNVDRVRPSPLITPLASTS